MIPWYRRRVGERAPYARLEERIGHRFGDGALLEGAVTHMFFLNEYPQAVATGREDNERLEFLGDAVLDLAIGHLLMECFPSRSEGELSKTRPQIISETGLAEVAVALG